MVTSKRIARALEKSREDERKKKLAKAAPEPIISKKITNVWLEDKNSYMLFTDSLRISVHHRIDAEKDAWFLTCHELQIDRMDLHTTDQAYAKGLATKTVRLHLQRLIDEVEKI